ncbi:MAG: hypothetical protein V7638_1858 [Acidobacteriota bacterium]
MGASVLKNVLCFLCFFVAKYGLFLKFLPEES